MGKIEMMKKNDLVRQMGNARFLITRSTKSLEGHRLAYKILGVVKDRSFEAEKFARMEVEWNGTKRWFLGNMHHRVDGPAVIFMNGLKYWYFEGVRHRTDGPAIEEINGTVIWYFKGKKHRVDGPAVEYPFGRREWWYNGKKHRVGGPAVEEDWDGSEEWWFEGERLK